MTIVVAPNRAGKQPWWRRARAVRDADERQRYLSVWYLAMGERSGQAASRLGCARATVVRVAQRFGREGGPGLWDHRRQNGRRRASIALEQALARLVAGTPQDSGWRRPTWTQELLVRQLARETGGCSVAPPCGGCCGVLVARRGRPQPVVRCPWPAAERDARVAVLRHRAQHPPLGSIVLSIVLSEDEVDRHLTPTLGPDWMLPGQQKAVVTPGQNAKRYPAGALNPETGRRLWVSGERKTSALFLDLLAHLLAAYPAAAAIHRSLDNDGIHHSKAVQAALDTWARRIRLHFRPPYCPTAHRSERRWLDRHAAVTRNHRCATVDALLAAVAHFRRERNQRTRAAHHTRHQRQHQEAACLTISTNLLPIHGH